MRSIVIISLVILMAVVRAEAEEVTVFVAGSSHSDLVRVLQRAQVQVSLHDDPLNAAKEAPVGAVVMVLAEKYPHERAPVTREFLDLARERKLRLYVEFPAFETEQTREVEWERVVVATDELAPTLEPMSILSVHRATFIPMQSQGPTLVLARVAGFDKAVFGLPEQRFPVLFEENDGAWLIASTKLSDFVTARYAPEQSWRIVWQHILSRLLGDAAPKIDVEPVARPAYARDEPLPRDIERRTFELAAQWHHRSRLLIHPSREPFIHDLLRTGIETTPAPDVDEPVGDGSHGVLEGYASQIFPDGSQLQRTPIRADCQTETAMVLAWDWALSERARSRDVAGNLLKYVYVTSNLHGGVRGDPNHPAFGMIGWGTISPAWEVANYGDDNARVILSTALASAALQTSEWDEAMLRAIIANLRTTGRKGFRGSRIDIPRLEQHGWRHFHDSEGVFCSPHYESWMWACYLWAYDRTGEPEMLEKSKSGLRIMMEAYPDGWLWRNNLERARLLLPLAWLVRVEDTPEHRQWLHRVADDLLSFQDETGAIREDVNTTGGGHFHAPPSNEAYGTTETPLIQSNDDRASDQLYTTGFALLGLREAAAATGDAKLAEAERKLAEFLCRIQIHCESIDYLHGAWFRAFDLARWEYWSSSADIGWGAWCIESGWGQTWTAATLALRAKKTTLWDELSRSQIKKTLPRVQEQMKVNTGMGT